MFLLFGVGNLPSGMPGKALSSLLRNKYMIAFNTKTSFRGRGKPYSPNLSGKYRKIFGVCQGGICFLF
jgi:hypothetical protein